MILSLGCLGVSEQALTSPAYSRSGSPATAPTYDSSGSAALIAKQGSVSVKVPEGTLQARFDSLQESLSEEGAKLSDISYNEYSDRKQYSMTVKVQPSKFDQMMDLVKEKGEVKGISVSLEDVTKRYVELDVRIENKEAELDRLRSLYNRTGEVSEILEIEKELTRVETELEILKQQKQDLVSKVDQSTIMISMYEEKPAVSKLTLSLEGLAGMFFGAVGAAITLIVLAAGFLIPLLIVIGVLWLAYRKIFGQRKGPKPPEHKRIPPEE